MKHELTAKRLAKALSQAGKIPQELANESGVSKSSISQYLNGSHKPSNLSSGKMAKVLGVNPLWLMGFDVSEKTEPKKNALTFDNVYSIEIHKYPLLGEIACGEPIFVNEERESYVAAGTNIIADFCLKAKGDSMIGARIYDGDVVFIKKTDIVNNGEVAAVIIDDEVLLKRFYYFPEENLLTLQSENPKYAPINYKNEELNHIKVLGKAVAFQSDVI